MPATMSKLASIGFGLVAVTAAAAANCPVDLAPYSSEANPFGWPLTPSDFKHTHPECWAEKYPHCAGNMQSPMDLDLANPDASCEVKFGAPGILTSKVEYPVLPSQTVMVSKYMRAAAVVGDLGKLHLQGPDGGQVEYLATGAYLTAGSLHTVNGAVADAELLIVHRPKDAVDEASGAVVLSMRFNVSADASRLFTQMGFSADGTPAKEGESWQAPESISLQQALEDALHGPVLSYSGSVPMPPCTENVQYLALTETRSVTAEQVEKLKEVLTTHAGGYTKRPAVARMPAGGACREVKADTAVIPHQHIKCPSASGLSAACWDSCAKSPINIESASTTMAGAGAQNATEMLAYRPTDHMTVSPSTYTLDVHGDFGGMMIQGRLFEATKLSIKAVAQHTIDGARHAGELVVHHSLFGERFGAGTATHRRRLNEVATATDDEAHSEAPPAAVDDGAAAATETEAPTGNAEEHAAPAGEHGAGHETIDSPREVMLSIPLKLGRENALLREFGLGNPSHRLAISHGNSYSLHGDVDLAAALKPSLSKGWYWYSGGPTAPDSCPEWGVKWMVFEEPLEVSLEQMNALKLPVSGMDSTRMPQVASAAVTKDSMPKGAVESGGWRSPAEECDSGMAQSPINIPTGSVNGTGTHNFLAKASWKPISGLRLMSTETGLHFETNQMGYFTLTGTDGYPKYYQMTSVDLKMPSEHMVDGRQYPAELQVTHNNQKTVLDFEEDDAIITSFLFDLGEESKLLKQLLPAEMPEHGSYATLEQPVDLMWALGPALDGSYFNYAGSYTTGRCSEVAQWLVFNHTMSLSIEQYQAFKLAFPGPITNRPVQALNGRKLTQNMLEEGEPIEQDFFLNRHGGRDRETPPIAYLAFPIIGTLSLCCVLMIAIFQREDPSRKEVSAGGLDNKAGPSTLGKSYNRL